MKIEDTIDIKKTPYVCPFDLKEWTPYGSVSIPKGFLSDGATGVLDLDIISFFVHDFLFISPHVQKKDGTSFTLTKRQVDYSYFKILWRNGIPIRAAIRFLGLSFLPPAYKLWKENRIKEKEDPHFLLSHLVPNADNWTFPSFHAKDAIWLGDNNG